MIDINKHNFINKQSLYSDCITDLSVSCPSQKATTTLVDVPIIYDHFITSDTEFIFVPTIRMEEWKSTLDESYQCVSNNNVTFFCKKINSSQSIQNKKNFLVFMTLFLKESNEELEKFYNFYRNQGVEKFYMYYNGELSAREKTLPVHSDVLYIEWNFKYWHHVSKNKVTHNAQPQAINVFCKKYKLDFEYVILADIDEFLISKKYKNIKTYLEKEGKVGHNSLHYYCHINLEKKELVRDRHSSHKLLWRGKSIVHSNFIDSLNIINIHQNCNDSFDKNLSLYHNKPQRLLKDPIITIWD